MSADRTLPAPLWRAAAAAHAARADALTAARRERAGRGLTDPVEDFLFEYYPLRPARLRRWHPGAGTALAPDAPGDPATPDDLDGPDELDARSSWRWHHRRADGSVALDVGALMADRGDGVRWIHDLLTRTAARAPQLGCLGLHEWAMVYRQDQHRHPLPLRLGQSATDAVVEGHPLRCTHFDAFRFFTAPARPLNRDQPERATQPALEQPGCLHATMDLLKHAMKLGPACPGDLLLDTFELARDVRVLDMRASPYDVTALGHEPVPIETARGRAEYVRLQRGFTERAAPLRDRLLEVTGRLVTAPADGRTRTPARATGS